MKGTGVVKALCRRNAIIPGPRPAVRLVEVTGDSWP